MKTCIFVILMAIITHNAAADVANAPEPEYTPQQVSDTPEPATHTGGILSRISVNTANPMDMNWTASMMELNTNNDFSQTAQYNVVLPFLEKYPIENLEIKLKLLDLQF